MRPAEAAPSVRARFAASSLWVVAGTLAGNLSSFLIFAILARLLSPAELGLVALAVIYVEFGLMVALAGIPDALVRNAEWNDDVASTAVWVGLGFSVAIAALGTLAAVLAEPWLPAGFGMVLAILSVGLVADGLRAVPEARLRREFRYRELAARTLAGSLLGGGVGVALAWTGAGLWALVAQRLLASLVQTALTWRAAGWRPRRHARWAEARPLVRFGLPLIAAQLASFANARVSEVVIGLVLGPSAVAYFRVGRRGLDLLVQTTIQPMQVTALSAMARLGGREAIARAYARLTAACALATAPAFLGAAVIAPDFVRVCFGPQWQLSGTVMSLLALVVGAATLRYFVGPVLTAAGHARLVMVANCVMLAGNLLAALVTAPWGVAAVALGQTLAAYLGLPFALGFLRRGVGVEPGTLLRGLAPPVLAASLMALLLLALRQTVLAESEPLLRLLVLVPAGAALYGLLLLALARRHLAELRALLPARFRR